MDELYTRHVKESFEKAKRDESKISDEILQLDGMTGKKTRHLYNNLLDMEDARYLEIGTWKGSSLCAAMYGNRARVFAMDNWSEFVDPNGYFISKTGEKISENFGDVKGEFLRNFYKFRGDNQADFIEHDCYTFDVSILPKFNIYLFDGPHEEENHYNALVHYLSCMDDVFIYIVDDWNWKNVRDGTKRSFDRLGVEIIYEESIQLAEDDCTTEKETWWNGVYVAVLRKRT